MSETRWVYYFCDPPWAGFDDLKQLLGGKGASLKAMCRAGLHVPPGFTISTESSRRFFELGREWPEGLEQQVRQNLQRLERETGRTFGRGKNPLLVSVRSGAAVSMPGMMDTLLNCGLHPGLAEDLGDTPHFWNLYLQFVRTFARVVDGIDEDAFKGTGPQGSGFGVQGSGLGGHGLKRNAEPRTLNPEPSSNGASHKSDLSPSHEPHPSRPLAEAYLHLYEQQTHKRLPTEPWDVLVACINAVFDSWHNERAVAYRKHHEIRGLKGTAVNVQMMFPSEISGVLFTQDPNNLAANRMVIEASYGLGEAVVSGEVTPDRFLVGRDDPSNVTAELGHKASVVAALGQEHARDPDAPSLSADQIAELCRLALRIEEHFGQPVDVEWGWADGRFAMLQSRAIRGLDVARDVEVGRQAEIQRLRALAGDNRRVWITHNLAETLRAPTPLSWDIVRKLWMSGSGGFGRMYQQLGYRPSRAVCEEGFLELIGGRIYADPDRLADLFWDGIPIAYELDSLLEDTTLLDRGPTKFNPDKADGRFLRKLPGTLLAMWRSRRILKRARRNARQVFEQEILPPYLEYVKQKRVQKLSGLSDEQVIAELRDRCEQVLRQFGPQSLKPGLLGGAALDALESILVQLMGKQEGAALASTLIRALEGDTTFEQDAMLYKVAAGEATLDEFLDRFGHRCSDEMELARPRWREDPAYLRQMIQRLREGSGFGVQGSGPGGYGLKGNAEPRTLNPEPPSYARSPAQIHQQNLGYRRAAEEELPSLLERWGGSSLRETLQRELATARELLPYREAGKHYLMMGYELVRTAIEELARRWDLGGDVYFLRMEELDRFTRDRRRLCDEIAARKLRWKALQRLEMADVIDSDQLDDLGCPRQFEAAAELEGSAVASGVATGTARIVSEPQQAGDLGKDYVLVCPSTDPGWTPLFLAASGLIVERGGVLSHGAIVARDFGIPAVVCPDATRLLRSGDRVRVDGNSGKITVEGSGVRRQGSGGRGGGFEPES